MILCVLWGFKYAGHSVGVPNYVDIANYRNPRWLPHTVSQPWEIF